MMTRRFAISAAALVAAAACTRALQAMADGSGDDALFPLRQDEAEWRRRLTPERFSVLRRGEPEPPFSSVLLGEGRHGIYACAGCGQDAFPSAAKFDAGSGWPSFWAAFYGAVIETEDRSAAAFRAALRCSRCGGHLGVLSRDAPTPTRLLYRADGLALGFKPAAAGEPGSG